jgi:hypothetical protein
VLGNTDGLPAPNGTCEMSDDEKKISQFLRDAWTSMAKSQKPSADDSQWPRYTSVKAMGLNIVNPTMPGNINYTKCKLWDDIGKKLLDSNGSGSGNGSGSENGTSSGSSGSNYTAGTPSPTGPPRAMGSTATGDASGTPSFMGLLVGMLAIAMGLLK